VYARKIQDKVTPISTEYNANRMVAVVNVSVFILADRNHTIANWAIMIPKKRILLEKTALRNSSEFDTRYAVPAVINNAAHIHTYTLRINKV
jgi:hypothetical protein